MALDNNEQKWNQKIQHDLTQQILLNNYQMPSVGDIKMKLIYQFNLTRTPGRKKS